MGSILDQTIPFRSFGGSALTPFAILIVIIYFNGYAGSLCVCVPCARLTQNIVSHPILSSFGQGNEQRAQLMNCYGFFLELTAQCRPLVLQRGF